MPLLHNTRINDVFCHETQRKLAEEKAEKEKQKLYEKKVKYSKMSAAKKERFRQIRMWKKTEVARLIQQWWKYLQKQRAYYEAVKLAQVCTLCDSVIVVTASL